MNKNEETLKKMYEIFTNYDINENENVDDKFLEMMSDYKNFNTLMNMAFGLDTSQFVTEETQIDDKRIVYNIKKFGPLYHNIYESYKWCFTSNNISLDETSDNLKNSQDNSHNNAYNSFVECYNEQLNNINKEELVVILKEFVNDIENDSLEK